jgi:hypothetical protein
MMICVMSGMLSKSMENLNQGTEFMLGLGESRHGIEAEVSA